MIDKRTYYLDKAKELHNNKYDYSLVGDIYRNTQYIDILCPIHGKFRKSVVRHIHEKSGCPKCAKSYKLNTSSFIERAILKHKDRYNYALVDYIGTNKKVTIICRKHGEFLQTPHLHLAGYGCARCTKQSSNVENEWLDSLGIDGLIRQYKINLPKHRYIVDAYDPKTNTVYEFNGDYFHGNPKYFDIYWTNKMINKTFGDLHRKTLEKEINLKNAGFAVVSVWEGDFLKRIKRKGRYSEMGECEKYKNKISFMKWCDECDDGVGDFRDFSSLDIFGPKKI